MFYKNSFLSEWRSKLVNTIFQQIVSPESESAKAMAAKLKAKDTGAGAGADDNDELL